MGRDIKARSIAAVGWSTIEAFSRLGLQFVVSIFLARLVGPEEFGTIAMIVLFTAVASVFIDSGFSAALIQKREVSQADLSSVFFFNLSMGLFMALLLCAAAPWIAAFLKTPVLIPLTRFMALNLFIATCGTVHSTLLSRDLDFRTQTWITVSASVISGGVAVVLAWRGWGVWSLAMMALSSTLVSTGLLWVLCPWRPSLMFKWGALRTMARFSGFLFVAALLDAFYARFSTLIVGRVYSARDLGFFTRADSTQQIPSQLLSTVVGRVMYPVFASVSNDKDLLRQGLRQVCASLMLVNVPVMLGLMATSHSVVLILYGAKWLPCVPYLQVLCLAGLLWPLHVVNLNILRSMGRSDLYFRVEVVKKLLGVAVLLAAVTISVLAIAWGRVLLSVVGFFINAYYAGILLACPPGKQLRDIMPCMVAGVFMAGAVWVVGLMRTLPVTGLLAAQFLTGAIVYLAFCSIFRIVALKDLARQGKMLLSGWRSSVTA